MCHNCAGKETILLAEFEQYIELLKRLKIIGLSSDVTSLIEIWFRNRCYYVAMNGTNSLLCKLLLGTAQGSIIGPVL
jgi:hypothetical protein